MYLTLVFDTCVFVFSEQKNVQSRLLLENVIALFETLEQEMTLKLTALEEEVAREDATREQKVLALLQERHAWGVEKDTWVLQLVFYVFYNMVPLVLFCLKLI